MSLHRRQCLLTLVAGCGALVASRSSWAQMGKSDDFERAAGELIKPATQAAIDRGLQWLVSRQNEDGSFGSSNGYSRNSGVSGLIGMALMSSGSMPDRGPFGENVSRL